MSADNGIYVVGFRNLNDTFEYRVALCSAIDNLYAINETDKELDLWSKWVGQVFKDNGSNVFQSKDAAMEYAKELSGDSMPTEYGIVCIDVDFQFPK